jgi:hypothetical protein
MKGTKLSLTVILATLLAAPCAAELIADVTVSSATIISQPRPGAGGLLGEGKPLEVLVWGSGGAVIGSLAGPLGTVIGAGAGALCGLVYSIFVVPHNGPAK